MKNLNLLIVFGLSFGCHQTLDAMKSFKNMLGVWQKLGYHRMSTHKLPSYAYDLNHFKPDCLAMLHLEHVWRMNDAYAFEQQLKNASAEHREVVRKLGTAEFLRCMNSGIEPNIVVECIYSFFYEKPYPFSSMACEDFKKFVVVLEQDGHLDEQAFDVHKIMNTFSLGQFCQVYNLLDTDRRFYLLRSFHCFFSTNNEEFVSKEIADWAQHCLTLSKLDFGQAYSECLQVETKHGIPKICVLKDFVW